MTGYWVTVLIFIGLWLIASIIKGLFFNTAREESKRLVMECLSKQALKRRGTVSGQVLTIPHQTIGIEVSFVEEVDEGNYAHTYATFRTECFRDKKFGIFYWKKLLLRPALLVGSRLEVSDGAFGETYAVSGNDLSFVEEVLTQEIRDKLLEFADANLRVIFGRPRGTTVLNQERGWLTVYAYCNAGITEKDYDSVIETAILFYERLEALNRR